MNLNQSYGSGGSSNSSRSISNTAGIQASNTAQQQTAIANSSAQSAWRESAAYNAEQAKIQREWQERMANTVYQRTVEDMKKAGINPVLAAGMGLGTASVGGGSAASISPSQVFNAQTFPESNSTSQANGNSWNYSESGLFTFAEALSGIGASLIQGLNSSHSLNIAINGLENLFHPSDDTKTGDGSTVGENNKNGSYKDVKTTFSKWIKNPKEIANDVLNYVTMKSSGGMLTNVKK